MYRLAPLAVVTTILIGCARLPAGGINSFEDCVAAGNPVMESYPRQCRAGDRTFVEQVGEPLDPGIQ